MKSQAGMGWSRETWSRQKQSLQIFNNGGEGEDSVGRILRRIVKEENLEYVEISKQWEETVPCIA